MMRWGIGALVLVLGILGLGCRREDKAIGETRPEREPVIIDIDAGAVGRKVERGAKELGRDIKEGAKELGRDIKDDGADAGRRMREKTGRTLEETGEEMQEPDRVPEKK